jgi:hypothetical protein
VALSPKELTAFRIAPELMSAMRHVKATKGIPLGVQVDFALRKWLKSQGVKVKAERKRAGTRKHP